MKYCANCGKELFDEAVMCPGCGCAVKSAQPRTSSDVSSVGTAAKVFMIISCVMFGWTLLPLAWKLPMTIILSDKLKNGEEITTGFKVCVLLFGNVIAGILLLCMD